jgi:catalase
MEGRKIGCLVADGTDAALVQAIKSAAKKAKADFTVIAPKVGGAVGTGGKMIEADMQLAGGPSVLFDAVFVAISAEGAGLLKNEAAAAAWVHDAFAHCKVIGATQDARSLLDMAGVIPDAGVLVGASAEAFVEAASKGRVWSREPKVRTIY